MSPITIPQSEVHSQQSEQTPKLNMAPNIPLRVEYLQLGGPERGQLTLETFTNLPLKESPEWNLVSAATTKGFISAILEPPAELHQTWRLVVQEALSRTILQLSNDGRITDQDRALGIMGSLYGYIGDRTTQAELGKQYAVSPNRVGNIITAIIREMFSYTSKSGIRLLRSLLPYDPESFAADSKLEWVHLVLNPSLVELPEGQDITLVQVGEVGEIHQLYSVLTQIRETNADLVPLDPFVNSSRNLNIQRGSQYNWMDIPSLLGIQVTLADLTVSQLLATDPTFLRNRLGDDQYQQLQDGIRAFIVRTQGVLIAAEANTLRSTGQPETSQG